MRRKDFVRYLWEAVLGAAKEGIPVRDLRFRHTEHGSAYMEMAMPYLNQEGPLGEKEIEVNTCDRFYEIFKDLFGPDLTEIPELRESLTNLVLHLLAENDVRRGMSREEYYKKLLAEDIRAGIYGVSVCCVFKSLSKEERETLLGGWLRSFRTGSSLIIFTDMVHKLIKNSIVYRNRACPDEILLYTGLKKTYELEQKLELLRNLFLDVHYHLEIFYAYHFGILGLDCTMETGEIAIY